jgi:hypothetical protein
MSHRDEVVGPTRARLIRSSFEWSPVEVVAEAMDGALIWHAASQLVELPVAYHRLGQLATRMESAITIPMRIGMCSLASRFVGAFRLSSADGWTEGCRLSCISIPRYL